MDFSAFALGQSPFALRSMKRRFTRRVLVFMCLLCTPVKESPNYVNPAASIRIPSSLTFRAARRSLSWTAPHPGHFQLAEVAVPRQLFVRVLEQISQLRLACASG
jgi:hypothetical protein